MQDISSRQIAGLFFTPKTNATGLDSYLTKGQAKLIYLGAINHTVPAYHTETFLCSTGMQAMKSTEIKLKVSSWHQRNAAVMTFQQSHENNNTTLLAILISLCYKYDNFRKSKASECLLFIQYKWIVHFICKVFHENKETFSNQIKMCTYTFEMSHLWCECKSPCLGPKTVTSSQGVEIPMLIPDSTLLM